MAINIEELIEGVVNPLLKTPVDDDKYYDLKSTAKVDRPIRCIDGMKFKYEKLKFHCYFTGSEGNSFGITNGVDNFLIDLGGVKASWKNVQKFCDNYKNLLISHEHGDHVNKSTIKKYLKRSRWVNMYIMQSTFNSKFTEKDVANTQLNIINIGDTIHIGDTFEIEVVQNIHGVPCCGWIIHDKVTKTVGLFTTDTCNLEYFNHIYYDWIFVEGNFDKVKLKDIEEKTLKKLDSDEYYDKHGNAGIKKLRGVYKRLQGSRGHCSKQQAMSFYLKQRKHNNVPVVFMHASSSFY